MEHLKLQNVLGQSQAKNNHLCFTQDPFYWLKNFSSNWLLPDQSEKENIFLSSRGASLMPGGVRKC